jgi:hypothetical protein
MNEAQKQKEELQKEVDCHKEKIGNCACKMFEDAGNLLHIIRNLTGMLHRSTSYAFECYAVNIEDANSIILAKQGVSDISEAVSDTCDLIEHLSFMYTEYARISFLKETIEQIEVLEDARNPKKEK